MEADDSATSSDKTYLDLIKDKIKVHIKNSDVYHKFKTSDKYKEYLQFKEDYKVAKQNLQEEIYSSQNPLLMVSRDLLVRILTNKFRTESTLEAQPPKPLK